MSANMKQGLITQLTSYRFSLFRRHDVDTVIHHNWQRHLLRIAKLEAAERAKRNFKSRAAAVVPHDAFVSDEHHLSVCKQRHRVGINA
jgi:hypothetical protein